MRRLQAFLRNVLTYHWASTFVIMGLLFLVGAASSYNLVVVLLANLRLISEHGWMALQDGALMQLIEITLTGIFSLAAYIGFKACERILVERLLTKI